MLFAISSHNMINICTLDSAPLLASFMIQEYINIIWTIIKIFIGNH